jgi:hypothetical protein
VSWPIDGDRVDAPSDLDRHPGLTRRRQVQVDRRDAAGDVEGVDRGVAKVEGAMGEAVHGLDTPPAVGVSVMDASVRKCANGERRYCTTTVSPSWRVVGRPPWNCAAKSCACPGSATTVRRAAPLTSRSVASRPPAPERTIAPSLPGSAVASSRSRSVSSRNIGVERVT